MWDRGPSLRDNTTRAGGRGGAIGSAAWWTPAIPRQDDTVRSVRSWVFLGRVMVR